MSRYTGIVFFDGGSRAKSESASGAAFLTWKGPTRASGVWIGKATNNEAEYEALLLGLDLALEENLDHVDIYGDSKLVVMQTRAEWLINSPILRQYVIEARGMLDEFETWTLQHVPRAENKVADKLANEIMDMKKAGKEVKKDQPIDLRHLVHPR